MSERETRPVSPAYGWARRAVVVVGWGAVASLGLWMVLVVGIVSPAGWPGAALGAAGLAALFGLVRPVVRALAVFAGIFAAVLVGYEFLVQPSQDRNWTVDAKVAPEPRITGDAIGVRNVRNFAYTSRSDFRPVYEDRAYSLAKLKSVDFIVSHFGSAAVAHTMLSFGFEGDEYLCISIEARKEIGETYSPLAGAFRQYELLYVVGDERDLIGARANFRNEELYLYRLRISPEHARLLLIDYLRRAEALLKEPEFYNTFTNNCTTNILRHAQSYNHDLSYRLGILLNGFSDRMAYNLGAFDTTLPFEELRRQSLINARAKAAGDALDFSRRIRSTS